MALGSVRRRATALSQSDRIASVRPRQTAIAQEERTAGKVGKHTPIISLAQIVSF